VKSESEIVIENEETQPGPKEFFLTEETLDITVSSGDKINVSTGSKLISFNVKITDIEQSLTYNDPDNLQKIMDLEKDMEKVILIEGDKGVYFYIKEVSADTITLIAQKVSVDETVDNTEAKTVVENSSEISSERIAEKIVIISETYPAEYEVDAFFRGDGLFRYRTDDQPSVERYYQAGERLKINVNRSVYLWISNAGIVDLKISGKEINVGGNGQVVVRSVKWIKNNETGKYELVILPYN